MSKSNHKPKGYNVHQVRLYSLTDELVSKEAFVDESVADKALADYLSDEQNGPLYSRGCIRCLDPILRGWVVRNEINNPKALLFDPDQTEAEEWRVTLYDMGDNPIASHCTATQPTEKDVNLALLTHNAFNCVISAREPGSTRFVVVKIQINHGFNLSVSGKDGRPVKPYMPKHGENLALVYAKALAQDQAETKRILDARAQAETADD